MKRIIAMLLTFALLLSLVSVSAFANVGETITGTITEDTTWNDGDVIGDVTISGDVTITVNGTVNIAGQMALDSAVVCDVVIKGNGTLLKTTDGSKRIIGAGGKSGAHHKLTIDGVTLDGGAVWTGDEDKILKRGTTNTGLVSTSSGAAMYLDYTDAVLKNGAIVQNFDAKAGTPAIYLGNYSELTLDGAVIRNNYSTAPRGGVIVMRQGAVLNAVNTQFYGNHGQTGGVMGASTSKPWGVKMNIGQGCKIYNNYGANGAVFAIQEYPDTSYETKLNYQPSILTIIGSEFYNNASLKGLIYSHANTPETYISDSSFHDNQCSIYDSGSTWNKNLHLSGDVKIKASNDWTTHIFAAPIQIEGALSKDAVIELNDATVTQLMTKCGYIASEAPKVGYPTMTTIINDLNPYEYTSVSKYTVVDGDLEKISGWNLNGTYSVLVWADVDGNGMKDLVPVNSTDTVTITLKDVFKNEEVTTSTQVVSSVVESVAVCYDSHIGYYFNGWKVEGSDTIVKNTATNILHTEGMTMSSTWALSRPCVNVSSTADKVEVGEGVTLTATIENQNDQYISYSYQWYKNGVAIEGATAATYTAPAETEVGTYTYRCNVYATDKDDNTSTLGKNYVDVTVYRIPVYVAEILETGVKYEFLSDAIAAANASEGADTIKLLMDIDFDAAEALSITGNITITGEHTISRGDYTGTLFTVPAGSSLTLDGGLILDGNNNWIFDEDAYRADMKINKSKHPYATTEEGAPVASGAVISIAGDLVVNKATIQNHYSTGSFSVFLVAEGAALTMNDGANVTHNYKNGSGLIAEVQPGGTWTMNEGSSINNNFGRGNGSLFYMKGTMVMNGGEICSNYGNGSGLIMIYSTSDDPAKYATFTMNGSNFCHNANFGGGWDSMIYVHYSDCATHDRGGTFTMNGGTFEGNECYKASTIVGNAWSSHIFLNSGIINEGTSHGDYYTTFGYEMTIGKDLTISNGRIRIKANSLIDGIVNSDVQLTGTGISQNQNGLWTESGTGMTIIGNGTVNGDTNVRSGALATIAGATWNGSIFINAVGVDTTPLTTSKNAIINDDVIVYVSVPSGEYTNATESADRQALAYVDNGAIFGKESDILYYHRLTSSQKDNIVVTFDYNGGLDSNGWSGCQITGDEPFVPACPAPTKEGYILLGWTYAVDMNPDSLNMEGDGNYTGETATQSIRLIAQWSEPVAVEISGKVWLDKEPVGGFHFRIEDAAGRIIRVANSVKSGNFRFADIEFTKEGTYTYTVYQVAGDDEDIVYDDNVYTVTVTVTQKNYKLQARVDVKSIKFYSTTVEKPTEPSEDPTEPIEPTEPTEPSVDPTDPTEPTNPSEDPTEPSETPTEPTEDPTEPSTTPTEPSEDPTAPSEEPTEPEHTDPSETPTEPTEESTDPSENPTDPSEDAGAPDEESPDESAPQAPSDPNENPKTGDADVFMSVIIGVMAFTAMAVLVLNKKRYIVG